MKERFQELDAIRGFLVLVMISYHALYSGMFIELWNFDFFSGFLWWYPRAIAAGFLLVSGVSLSIRARKPGVDRKREDIKAAREAGILLAFGLAISLVTWFALGPTQFVAFGVLHILAAMRMLGLPFARRPLLSLCSAIAILAAGLALGQARFGFPWLAILGFRPEGYYPIDFFPLLPWASWYLFGIFFGNVFYTEAAMGRRFKRGNGWRILGPAAFLGRHSLAIYVGHVPVLIGILWVAKMALLAL